MKFAYAARDREVAFIIRLLTIFGSLNSDKCGCSSII